jgi:hypothetical protein
VRGDHVAVLLPGDTVLLSTDGLVERRGAGLDEGFAWLVQAASAWAERDLEGLCDHLLDEVRGAREDDVVLLALRVHPQDRPRPSEAGRSGCPGTASSWRAPPCTRRGRVLTRT